MKILLLRFSAIGDLVLTSPVARHIKAVFPEAEVHFFTKKTLAEIISHDPNIDKVHVWEKHNFHEALSLLKQTQFDYVLDLHKNWRTLRVVVSLKAPFFQIDKQTIERQLLTKLHWPSLTIRHVTDRYLEVAQRWAKSLSKEIVNDGNGLSLFLPPHVVTEISQKIHTLGFPVEKSIAVVLGATHATKKWLPAHFITTLNQLGKPVVLLGGEGECEDAAMIANALKVPVWNTTGKYGLLESAAILKMAQCVLAHDTGFMHIAVAFRKPLVVLWGSTAPTLGFAPYQSSQHISLEVENLHCHPCATIGLAKCPKQHFKCMKDLAPSRVVAAIHALM